MGSKDPRIDAYIAKAAPFAQPILQRFRSLVHKACPDVQETIKWGMPSFEYKGPFCSMAAFKKHCVFGFWKAALLDESQKDSDAAAMNWGAPGRDPIPARIESDADLPSDATILRLIRKAAKLNDEGVKVPLQRKVRKPLPLPRDFAAAIAKSKTASKVFAEFSPSCKREYIEWITEAKREETRSNRIATAVEWIAEGKQRNWKYMKK
ncbi:MAG: YdeI/OmpD-associated family protein [Planctomycetes bacterium]|nr:YdeI/OmpD-associated family protein [Planctomycetota bacterium]